MLQTPQTPAAPALGSDAQGADDVVALLETDIIFGRLYPRERLIEDELMQRFGVTRHRVRRAIGDLVKRGLVVQERNRGAHVRDYSRRQVEELYEVRNCLQTRAIRRLTAPPDADTLATLQELHDAHVEAGRSGDVHLVYRLNNAFHERFFDACGNAELAEAIRAYAWRTHPIRSRSFMDDSYRQLAQRDHQQMIEALAVNDTEALVALNLRHTNRPCRNYLDSLR